MNTYNTPAQEIACQIGGGSFFMMGTDRKYALNEGKTLRFNVKCRGSKCKAIGITLDPDDTYTITSYKRVRHDASIPECIRKHMAPEYESILTVVGIYADQLHDILEDMTGLVVRKPRVTFA
jgi:hypothetical protein